MVVYVFDGSSRPPRPIATLDFVAPYGPLAHVDIVYHREWLKSGYSLGPEMPLGQSTLSMREIPGALRDAGPDSWGRSILVEALNAQGRSAELSHDGDVILSTPDLTRPGSLRFSPHPTGGDWMGNFSEDRLPGLVDTKHLLHAIERYEDRAATADELDLLLRAATSAGGARPKAAIFHNQSLALVKFPSGQDRWDVIGWEAVTLKLARRAGIRVPGFNHQRLSKDRSVLILERFDRAPGGTRYGYISAMTLLGHHPVYDTDQVSYAQQARRQAPHLGNPEEEGQELFRRVVFGVAVNNADDHLRNHGYLHRGDGWHLSPAFDINPWPLAQDGRPVADTGRSIEAAIENAEAFSLSKDSARDIARSVIEAVRTWPECARDAAIPDTDLSVMEDATAFAGDETRRLLRTATPFGPAKTGQGQVWVEGHFRGKTWVEGYWRSSPDSN